MKPPCKFKFGAHPARLLLTVVATWLAFAGFQQEAVGQTFTSVRLLVPAGGTAKFAGAQSKANTKGRTDREVCPTCGWRQDTPKVAKGSTKAVAEIRALMDEYLRLHAAKDMANWVKTFLPEATIVRTADDGKVIAYKPAELAKSIADEAVKLESQHETFEDIVIDVEGDAASYAGTWRLFHNGKELRDGRAFYTLVKRDGKWLIASLVWYRRAGSGVR